MYFNVVSARYIEGYKLEITFENGRSGIVDLCRYAKKGGLFSRLLDMDYFKRFNADKEVGSLCWPDGLDVAPETLYTEATGEPLPEWMKTGEERKAG